VVIILKRDCNGEELRVGDYAKGFSGLIYMIIDELLPSELSENSYVSAITIIDGHRSDPAFCNLTKMDPKDVMLEVLIGETDHVA
jgi:hypothetical protein